MASHLTFREREFLYRLLKARKPKAEIAELMGRDRSTIYREIKRNTVSPVPEPSSLVVWSLLAAVAVLLTRPGIAAGGTRGCPR